MSENAHKARDNLRQAWLRATRLRSASEEAEGAKRDIESAEKALARLEEELESLKGRTSQQNVLIGRDGSVRLKTGDYGAFFQEAVHPSPTSLTYKKSVTPDTVAVDRLVWQQFIDKSRTHGVRVYIER